MWSLRLTHLRDLENKNSKRQLEFQEVALTNYLLEIVSDVAELALESKGAGESEFQELAHQLAVMAGQEKSSQWLLSVTSPSYSTHQYRTLLLADPLFNKDQDVTEWPSEKIAKMLIRTLNDLASRREEEDLNKLREHELCKQLAQLANNSKTSTIKRKHWQMSE
jgi:DNA-binding transcriptional regulator PaaX